MGKLKLGYKASAEQFGPRELLEFGVYAEECGFDSVVVSDHFQPWRHTDGHAPYSFVWIAALGERTKRVQLAAILSRLDVGEMIPPELYAVVAEVLAYVYRLDARVARRL